MVSRPERKGGDGPVIRKAPCVILASIYTYVLWVLVSWVFRNNLMSGDGAGHLMLAQFTGEHLLPWGAGWCDRAWGGFAAGQLYSPLFHILAGALSHLAGTAIAVKSVVVICWLAIPAALFTLAGNLARRTNAAQRHWTQSLLLLAFWAGLNAPSELLATRLALGTSLESAVGNGMFPSALGVLFYALLLGTLTSRRGRSVLSTPLLLAVTVLSHPVWGLVGAATALAFAGADIARTPRAGRLHTLASWTGLALAAVGASAFFTFPLLTHRELLVPTHLPSHWNIKFIVCAAIALALIAWRRRQLSPEIRTMGGLAAVLAALVGIGEATEASFHLLRLTIPFLFLLLPALAYALVSTERGATGVSRLLRMANLVMFLTTAVLFHAMGPVSTVGPPEMDVPALPGYAREQGRIALVAEEYHTPGYMALPHLAAAAGATASHGISVESARNGRLIFGLLRKLGPGIYAWGVEMAANPASIVPDRDLTIAAGQLDLLGFSHILTDRRLSLPPGALEPGPPEATRFANYFKREPDQMARLSRDYYLEDDGDAFLHRLHKLTAATGLTVPAPQLLPVPEELFPRAAELWFAEGGIGPLPVLGFDRRLPAVEDLSVTLKTLSPTGDAMELAISACCRAGPGPWPLFVKVPWHPHWRATDAADNRLPIYPAGTGMVVLATGPHVALEYAIGGCDIAGRIVSPVTVLVLVLFGWFTRRRRSDAT